VQVILIAFDCVNPAVQKARIKVYLRTESTDWEVARDVMTLGGRLQDDASQKRISIMQSLWPLLMGNTATHAANGKRVQFWPYTGLLYNVNLTKNNDVPETQCYVCTSAFGVISSH
jgi:DMATS type aromatic prenyltransferase